MEGLWKRVMTSRVLAWRRGERSEIDSGWHSELPGRWKAGACTSLGVAEDGGEERWGARASSRTHHAKHVGYKAFHRLGVHNRERYSQYRETSKRGRSIQSRLGERVSITSFDAMQAPRRSFETAQSKSHAGTTSYDRIPSREAQLKGPGPLFASFKPNATVAGFKLGSCL